MIIVELKRIIKEAIIFILILAALTAYILTTDKDPLIPSIIFMVSLLIYASFAGWSMFDRERQEGAEEYMFSLPVSRTRLFFLKFIPRFFFALLMLGGFLLLHHFIDFPIYYPTLDFSILYLSFFLISLSLSISLKNFIGAFFLAAFFSVGLPFFIKMLETSISEFSALLIASTVLLLFPAAFFILFLGLDIKPLRSFNLKFFPPLLVIVGLLLGYFWWTGGPIEWYGYYLTSGGDIVRMSHSHTQLIKKHEKKTLEGSFLPLMETNGQLYMMVKRVKKGCECQVKSLVSLDLEKGSTRTVLEPPEGWYLSTYYPGKSGVVKDNTYYNLLLNEDEMQFKILIVAQDDNHHIHVSEIPIYGNFYREPIQRLFHVAGEPLQFFVYTKSRIYRVFESGEAEELFPLPGSIAVWKNRLMVFNGGGMTLFEIGEQLRPICRKQGHIRKVYRRFGSLTTPVVLFNEGRKLYLFGLEDQRIEPLEFTSRPRYYHYDISSDVLHLLWLRGDNMIYARRVNGKILQKKKWHIELVTDGLRWVIPFPSGIVVYNQEAYDKYLFKKKIKHKKS